MLQNIFADEIANRSVDVQRVRNKNIFDEINATEKQVVDKVRSSFRPSPEKRKRLDMGSVFLLFFSKEYIKAVFHMLGVKIIYSDIINDTNIYITVIRAGC